MFAKLFERVSRSGLLSVILKIAGRLTPEIAKLKKYKNILYSFHSIHCELPKINNNPLFIQMAPTSICNYKCLFCEIHKDNLMYPKRPNNMIDIQKIKNYESFLATAYKLVFSGGTAEPLLNKDFSKIVEYLKTRYGNRMTVNTNASMLNPNLSDTLIKHRFDKILVSYHAGSQDGYKELMSGDIDRVDNNLQYINEKKKSLRRNKPVIQFNFALQRLNSKEYPFIFKKAKRLGATSVVVNKYYGGRNLLQGKQVSYDYDIKEGNQVLDKIYDYAKKENVNLNPSLPDYWVQEEVKWKPENFNANIKCYLPWIHLHFKPVLSDKNCHYVGVCNRTELFKVNYDQISFSEQDQFHLLWNHPVLQYLRITVNSKEKVNPICKYCKNCDRWTLRNIDAEKYAEVRDKAMKDFFIEFRKDYTFHEIEGIEILDGNPYSDEEFKEKLSRLETK